MPSSRRQQNKTKSGFNLTSLNQKPVILSKLKMYRDFNGAVTSNDPKNITLKKKKFRNEFISMDVDTEIPSPPPPPPIIFGVTSTDPFNNEANVDEGRIIVITFNKNINPATVNIDSITFFESGSATNGVFNVVDNIVTFTPEFGVGPDTHFIATITLDVEDTDGGTLAAPYTWQFFGFSPGFE